MTASFPSSLKSYTTKIDNVTQVLAEDVNSPQEEIVAIETLLGVNGLSWIGEGQMMNGFIQASVSSNNLTVQIRTMAGTAPSASAPVYVRINGAIRKITGALSVTKNAGTNWCNAGGAELATKEIDYFVYLGYNATDGVVVGFSRIPYGTLYSSFSATSTNDKYCAISTITNAAAGDYYINIGRFAATLSAGAGYTWTVPTFTNANLIQRPIYETRLLDWTATYTNLTTTTGTLVAKYQINNNRLNFTNSIVFGASSAITGGVSFVMPMSRLAGVYSSNNGHTAHVRITDSGTATFTGTGTISAATFTPLYSIASTANVTNAVLSATAPMTWTTNDELSIICEYWI
jgi:hypothetical protein